MHIKTGAVDASTPIGAGAVMSVVTQSGTNRVKGATGFAYQGEGSNANNASGGTSTAFGIFQPDVSLGGRPWRDRAWFFGASRYTYNSLGISRTPTQIANLRALVPGIQPLASDTEASYHFAKVAAQLTPSHRIEGFWQSDHSPEAAVGPNWGGPFLERDFGGIATGLRLASVWRSSLATRVNVSFNTAVGPPLNGTVEVAGPEQFRFDELIRRASAHATTPARLSLTRTPGTSGPKSASTR